VVDPDTPVTTMGGLRVSTPMQTFVELAEELNLVDLVVVGDALVAQKRFSPEELRAFCESSTQRGATAAREAAAYVRAEVDSPMETRLRMLIVLAGLPEPIVNFKVYYADGRVRYRFDLSYPGLKIAVEYDGRQHRDDLDVWDHDTERRDWFDHNGWMLVPVFSRGIFRRPDKTLVRVSDALKSRGCADLPSALSDDWRRFFPIRA
jgi:very-short-patch-repair endonuclease